MKKFFIGIILISFSILSCRPTAGRIERNSRDTDSLSFIVIGDWGMNGSAPQKAVAEQIDIIGRKNNVQFIITTGDNFYPTGVTSTSDPHWERSFNLVYDKKGHMVPWYPTVGNHDYNGSPSAQIEY